MVLLINISLGDHIIYESLIPVWMQRKYLILNNLSQASVVLQDVYVESVLPA